MEYVAPWNGGTLTTAGNLVFQGTADGRFVAYDATHGEKLWETPTGTGVVAAATTYLLDGVQYVSVAVGWGGVFGIPAARHRTAKPRHGLYLRDRRQGTAAGLREVPDRGPAEGVKYDPKDVTTAPRSMSAACAMPRRARRRQGRQCQESRLRSDREIANLKDIVFKGPFRDQGMPDFTGRLKEEDIVEDPGLHPGHRGRDPSEVATKSSRDACEAPDPEY